MAQESEVTKVGEDTKVVTPPLETVVPPKVEPTPQEENPEVKQKAEHLANINIAIAEETEKLRKVRENQRRAKLGLDPLEDELPQIDLKDPSSKAWNKRIEDATAPANRELEKAKEERRLFTLRQFLSDKPALAKNPEKIKAMMETYDRLKTSTELTSEGITMDLEKAYAAEHSEELVNLARQGRVETARNDAILADPAVTKDSTSYSKEQPKQRTYSEEEKSILIKWGMTPTEHATMEEEMRKKM